MPTVTETAECLAIILPLFPTLRLSESDSIAMARAWQRQFADVPVTEFLAVLDEAARESGAFFPSFGLVCEVMARRVAGPSRPGLEAWGDVLAKVREHGYLRQPTFEDPLVARLVSVFGWMNICMSEEGMVDRAHFIRAYDALAQTARRETLQLAGRWAPQLEEGTDP